jgi:twitching motility protein PilT
MVMPFDAAAISAIDEPRVEQPVARAEVKEPAAGETIVLEDDLRLPDATQLWPARKTAARPAIEQPAEEIDLNAIEEIDIDVEEPKPVAARVVQPPPKPVAPPPAPVVAITPPAPSPASEVTMKVAPAPLVPKPAPAVASPPRAAAPPKAPPSPPPPAPVAAAPPPAPVVEVPRPVRAAAPRAVPPPPPRAERPAPIVVEPPGGSLVEPVLSDARESTRVEGQPAVVLPISRSPIRPEAPPPLVSDVTLSGLERLLRLSSARGASALYLSSESRPSVRVDGELQMLDGEPVHTSRDVESLLLTLMPERSHEALRTGAQTEWITDIEGVGRVRCMSFRDHRGPGGVFRLMPTRSVSVEQLGLPRHVQSLAIEPEGLVLIAGPRSSGKRTMMAAFVDLMNRTRRDHIITIEREINIVHERGNSFISQREVRGNDDEMLAAARGALREDPDVLMIEDLRTGGLMNVALEAAASGHLVVGGFSAHTATGAIDRIIDLYAPEYRRQVQFALADSLRGVIVQVLLKKVGGGRLPAREVLLNTPAVSSVIAEGKTSQLPMAIEGGRRYGMMPLNDALVGLVQSGAVEARDAYRQSTDRPGFLAALSRQGIDTSFVERLA